MIFIHPLLPLSAPQLITCRYIGPFEILRRIETLAYELVLAPQLSHIHNVFYVLILRKYVSNSQHVIDFQTLEVKEDVSYKEMPTSILERKKKILRNRSIPLVKVQSQRHSSEEVTWELEEEMRHLYPSLFK